MNQLMNLVQSLLNLGQWHALFQLLALAVLIMTGFLHFIFAMRLERRLSATRHVYYPSRPLRLSGTSWLYPLAGGIAMIFLSISGPLDLGRSKSTFFVCGVIASACGLWMGYHRDFIIRGELSRLIKDLQGPAAHLPNPKGVESGADRPVIYHEAMTRRDLRPFWIVLVLTTLASLGTWSWTKFCRLEDREFYRQVTIVMWLCTAVVLAMIGYLYSATKE